MIKSAPILLFVCTLLFSCNQPERGTLDVETLSKKLFDIVRDNDIEKSALILPDKGTFRKIEMEKGNKLENLNAAYTNFELTSLANLSNVISMITTWPDCKYQKSTVTESKTGKLSTAKVSAKFADADNVYRYEFTAIKFNNRWYYYGDIIWVAKTN